MIELEPERHDELAALIAQHMEEGGETLEAARWSARAAYWAGHSRPQDALRLWREVTRARRRAGGERGDGGAGALLAPAAARLRLAAGHGRRGRNGALVAEAEEIADADRRPALAGPAEAGDLGAPGPAAPTPRMDRGRRRSRRARRRVRRPRTCGSRSAPPAPTRTCAPATSTASSESLDEVLELAGGDRTRRRRNRASAARSPGRLMGKGIVRRERGQFDEAEELVEEALRIAGRGRRPRDRKLDRAATRRCAGDRGATSRRRWRWPSATAS